MAACCRGGLLLLLQLLLWPFFVSCCTLQYHVAYSALSLVAHDSNMHTISGGPLQDPTEGSEGLWKTDEQPPGW
jgi:hypothetical protein